MRGVRAAVSAASSQCILHAATVMAQPASKRLGFRRCGSHELDACTAPCCSGDTDLRGRRAQPRPTANKRGSIAVAPEKEQHESPYRFCAVLGRFCCVGICHASPPTRYHRQVAAADHDASPSNGRRGRTVFCAQHSVLRRMLIFAPGRRRMSDLILPIKVQGRAGW